MKTYSRVVLNDVPRQFPFTFPLKSIGSYPGDFSPNEKGKRQRVHFRFPLDQYELSLRLSAPAGKLEQSINGEVFRVAFPHVILKCPGDHYMLDSPYTALHSLCLTYSAEIFQPVLAQHFSAGSFIWEVELTAQVMTLVRKLQEDMVHSRHYAVADRLDLNAFMLVEELLLQRLAHGRKSVIRHPVVEEIASYLQLNCRRRIDLNSLIESHGISSSTFFRQWKSHFHETPANYVNRLRIEEACRLLRESSCSISEISEQLGFTSVSYFCAAFRKQCGCSPAVWKKHADS